MLELKEHLHQCPSCTSEWHEISETRRLLRSLLPHTLPAGSESRLYRRLEEPQQTGSQLLLRAIAAMALHSLTVPLHGRKIAAALAVSSFVVLTIAPPFAPPRNDASTLVSTTFTSPASAGMAFLPEANQNWASNLLPYVHMASFAVPPPQPPQSISVPDDTVFADEPLRDQMMTDYVQGNAAFAEYHADAPIASNP